ncbi:MAG: hypothetical protein JWR20_180 [Marmoricola sp.]|nr:hypothetical protein [Marmoricola sp.]
MSLLWLLIGLLQLRTGLRFRGASGRTRFGRLSERRALGVHERFTGRVWLFVSAVGLSSCALSLFFAAVTRSVLGMVVGGAAAVLLVVAAAVGRRTAVDVAAAFSERGLEPTTRRETSVKRDRRQLQFGVVALVGNAVSEIAQFFAVGGDQAGMVVLAGVATVITFGAVAAFLWSTAWVFRDEQRV